MTAAQPRRPKTPQEKIELFRSFFTGLTRAYGTYDPATGNARQVKKPVTDAVIHDHLRGRRPYGVYLLVGDRTAAVVVDLDHDDPRPAMEFAATAESYGAPAYVERSKSKGYHVWIFFEPAGAQAAKARALARQVLRDIGEP